MELKKSKRATFYLIFIHFFSFSVCTCGDPGKPKSEILPGFFSNSSPNEERNWQTPANPPSSPPIIPIPDGFGNSGPEVRFGFLPASVDRYRPLELVFSEPMDTISVANALVVRNITENIPSVSFSLVWTSPLHLNIRLGQEMKTATQYEIEISNNAKSALGTNLIPFKQSFTSEKTVQLVRKVVINSNEASPLLVGSNRGIVLSSDGSPNIKLIAEINYPEDVQELLLCKLGTNPTNAPNEVVCSTGVAYGVKICETSCQANQSVILTDSSVLAPSIGPNLYFFRVKNLSGTFSYFSANFLYGKLATDTNASRSKVASLLLGSNDGINPISKIISEYAGGKFTLFESTSNSDYTLNQFISRKKDSFPGGNCLPWPTSKLQNANPTNKIRYLEKIGPFCGIEVTGSIFESNQYPSVDYRAVADVYITELVLEEASYPSGDQNLDFQFSVQNGRLDIVVRGKKVKGKFAIVLKVQEIEFFDYLLANTLIYYGTNISGTDGDEVSFFLNENPPSETPRVAEAKTNLSIDASGNVSLNILTNFDPNPIVSDWSNFISVNSISGTGAVASIVGDVINQQIPTLKNNIVQNVLKDITERVTPEIINNILGQVKSGVDIRLPDYLPNPLNKVILKLNAKLETDTSFKRSNQEFGLEGSLDASLKACVQDSLGRCPWNIGYTRPSQVQPPLGTPSYIVSKSTNALPSQLSKSTNFPGVLLSIHPDLINQALYQLWWNGGFEFEVNQNFISTINRFVGNSTLLRLTTSLLKADPIVTIFAPGQNFVQSASGSIYPNDDVTLSILPISPIHVGVAPLTGSQIAENPKLAISFPDLEITIKAKKTDPNRPSCPNPDCLNQSDYTIAKVRMSLQSKANLNFGSYVLPPCEGLCNFSPSILSSVGNPSIRLTTSSAIGDLFYLVEPKEGVAENPLGLRPSGIKEIVEPLVQSLIIPLLNNITKDIPLPKIRACGLDLYDLNSLSIPGNSIESYFLIHAKLRNIPFTGSCRI
ncbi:MAG: Ig-like domain-containing protein [Leptospira sp.]|nr:Ig-like domain-containing protein [Leptospira sp.]